MYGNSNVFSVNSEKLNKLLVSVYEGAIYQILKLTKVQEELRLLNENLESLVSVRTGKLSAEIETRKEIEGELQASVHLYHNLFHNANEGL